MDKNNARKGLWLPTESESWQTDGTGVTKRDKKTDRPVANRMTNEESVSGDMSSGKKRNQKNKRWIEESINLNYIFNKDFYKILKTTFSYFDKLLHINFV